MRVLLAGLLAASLTVLAPAPPASDDLPGAIQRTLAGRWAAAFDTAACGSVKRSALGPSQASAAARCGAAAACVSRAAKGSAATVVATAKISSENGRYQVSSALVEVATGKVLEEYAPPAVASPGALDGAFGVAAKKLCAALGKAAVAASADLDLDLEPAPAAPAPRPVVAAKSTPHPAERPATAQNDLDLDLDLDLAPAKPPTAPAAKAPEKPAPAPKPVAVAVAPPVARAPTAETILATAPAPAPPRADFGAFDLPPQPPEPPAASASKGGHLAAWLAGGASLLAGGGGLFFGLGAVSAARTRDAALEPAAFDAAQAVAARDGRLTNVAWGLAAGAAVTSTVLFLLSSASP